MAEARRGRRKMKWFLFEHGVRDSSLDSYFSFISCFMVSNICAMNQNIGKLLFRLYLLLHVADDDDDFILLLYKFCKSFYVELISGRNIVWDQLVHKSRWGICGVEPPEVVLSPPKHRSLDWESPELLYLLCEEESEIWMSRQRRFVDFLELVSLRKLSKGKL